jgi:hypothetical protein
LFAADLAGVVLQGNDAQVNSFYSCDFAGPKIAVLDDGFLGNYFYGCHWAFNCGLQAFNSSNVPQIIGGYFESYTGFAAANGMFFGTTSLSNGGGLRGFGTYGRFTTAPALMMNGPVIARNDGKGDGAAQFDGDVLSHGTGTFVIQNNGNPYGSSGAATGYLRMWLNGGDQAYIRSASDLWLDALGGAVQLRSGDNVIATVSSGGINVTGGKALSVGGQQVVGARGASLPADATDLASAIALVNAIKARLKTSGGHGLVAD